MSKFIAYTRVSTKDQNLGAEAQLKTILTHIGSGELVGHYTEKESGKNNKRIELTKALQECKLKGATLIVAKLDRLSRDLSFLMLLKSSDVNFKCCDIPEINTLTLGIFGTIAQYERELISERTVKALQTLKDKGVVLGKPENLYNNHKKAIKNSVATRLEKARLNENNQRAYGLIKVMRKNGCRWTAIMNELNGNGFLTSSGKPFFVQSVQQVYELYNKEFLKQKLAV